MCHVAWQVTSLSSATAATLVAACGVTGVAAAFATAVPFWYCVMCPVVLGLVAPLVVNYGLGEVTNIICQHYNLDTQECFDLG